jgi:hypothetical protein
MYEERERENGGGGIVVSDTTIVGDQGNNIFGFGDSQAVPASPSGRGEDFVQD